MRGRDLLVINVIGKPGSGKSLFASELAYELSSCGKSVAYVSTDLSYASIQLLFRRCEIPSNKSIGLFFNMNGDDSLTDYFVKVKGFRNLYICGYSLEDNCLQYELPSRGTAELFIKECTKEFNYVILENKEDRYNALSMLGISMSDFLIDIINIDRQGIAYKLSHECIADKLFNGKVYRIANKINKLSKCYIDKCAKIMGIEFDYLMPYINSINKSYKENTYEKIQMLKGVNKKLKGITENLICEINKRATSNE